MPRWKWFSTEVAYVQIGPRYSLCSTIAAVDSEMARFTSGELAVVDLGPLDPPYWSAIESMPIQTGAGDGIVASTAWRRDREFIRFCLSWERSIGRNVTAEGGASEAFATFLVASGWLWYSEEIVHFVVVLLVANHWPEPD